VNTLTPRFIVYYLCFLSTLDVKIVQDFNNFQHDRVSRTVTGCLPEHDFHTPV
jgi:hypothetical protein